MKPTKSPTTVPNKPVEPKKPVAPEKPSITPPVSPNTPPTTDLTYDDIDILGDVQTAEITAKNDTDSTTKKVTVLKSDIIEKNKASNHKTGHIKAIYYGEGTAKTYWFGKLLNTEVEPRVKIIIDFTPPRTSTEKLFDVND